MKNGFEAFGALKAAFAGKDSFSTNPTGSITSKSAKLQPLEALEASNPAKNKAKSPHSPLKREHSARKRERKRVKFDQKSVKFDRFSVNAGCFSVAFHRRSVGPGRFSVAVERSWVTREPMPVNAEQIPLKPD
jgi:hypothetical protein